jgi:hypothetical protein
MAWEIEITDEFRAWYKDLTLDECERINAAVEKLEIHGPALDRPYADTVEKSRYRNMKELRPRGGFIRILFAFDPRRHAILLIGGNKEGLWTAWYDKMIPIADKLYDQYLAELRAEGVIN